MSIKKVPLDQLLFESALVLFVMLKVPEVQDRNYFEFWEMKKWTGGALSIRAVRRAMFFLQENRAFFVKFKKQICEIKFTPEHVAKLLNAAQGDACGATTNGFLRALRAHRLAREKVSPYIRSQKGER
jgi:hypothetical protein